MFDKIYSILEVSNQINYENIDFSNISLDLIELLMEIFIELEDSKEAWSKDKFMQKINECWKNMTNIDKN
jgi:hypothetical protein